MTTGRRRCATTGSLKGGKAVFPASIAAGVGAYLWWRPRMVRWGATDQEATERLPGDEVEPEAHVQFTHAVTIDAPREAVWPWIVQMGIERAGFYTHDWLERLLFHARYAEGRHSATRIHPELQDLKVGDRIPYGGGVFAQVYVIEPPSHLVAAEAFVLRALRDDRTRLIVRYRGKGFIAPAMEAIGTDAPRLSRLIALVITRTPGLLLVARAVDFFIADPLHHYMEKGMLMGIKARAEGAVAVSESPSGMEDHDVATG